MQHVEKTLQGGVGWHIIQNQSGEKNVIDSPAQRIKKNRETRRKIARNSGFTPLKI